PGTAGCASAACLVAVAAGFCGAGPCASGPAGAVGGCGSGAAAAAGWVVGAPAAAADSEMREPWSVDAPPPGAFGARRPRTIAPPAPGAAVATAGCSAGACVSGPGAGSDPFGAVSGAGPPAGASGASTAEVAPEPRVVMAGQPVARTRGPPAYWERICRLMVSPYRLCTYTPSATPTWKPVR